MTRLKRIPVTVVPVLAVLAGFVCAIAGLYLLAELVLSGSGAGVALLAGGVALVVSGLVVDVD